MFTFSFELISVNCSNACNQHMRKLTHVIHLSDNPSCLNFAEIFNLNNESQLHIANCGVSVIVKILCIQERADERNLLKQLHQILLGSDAEKKKSPSHVKRAYCIAEMLSNFCIQWIVQLFIQQQFIQQTIIGRIKKEAIPFLCTCKIYCTIKKKVFWGCTRKHSTYSWLTLGGEYMNVCSFHVCTFITSTYLYLWSSFSLSNRLVKPRGNKYTNVDTHLGFNHVFFCSFVFNYIFLHDLLDKYMYLTINLNSNL